MIKQVIVIRKDLKMRKGKTCAQAAHASMKVFLDRGIIKDSVFQVGLTPEMQEWLVGLYTKICVYVNSEEELLAIYKQSVAVNLPIALVRDAGLTEFHGVPTYTCIAIGPAEAEAIDKITGNLPLL